MVQKSYEMEAVNGRIDSFDSVTLIGKDGDPYLQSTKGDSGPRGGEQQVNMRNTQC